MSNFITKNFQKDEFRCGKGKCKYCGGEVIIVQSVVNKLQQLRDRIKRPIVVTSGYRCQKHNEEIGGSINSGHLFGLAIDFYSPGLQTTNLWEFMERIGINGMGSYIESNGFRFLHIDIKLRFSRWVRREIDGRLQYVYLF